MTGALRASGAWETARGYMARVSDGVGLNESVGFRESLCPHEGPVDYGPCTVDRGACMIHSIRATRCGLGTARVIRARPAGRVLIYLLRTDHGPKVLSLGRS